MIMPDISKYFDYAATTPVHPDVVNAMSPYFSECFGNPSSAHRWGQDAFTAVEEARESLSKHFHTNPENICFTGSSTESNNTVLNHFVMSYWNENRKPGHLIISPLEHSAIGQTAQHLHEAGFCVLDYIPVDHHGIVNPDDLSRMIRKDTVLVSVIYGNNEIGSVNPIPDLGNICKMKNVPFHTDATQFAAHQLVDLQKLPVDFISIAAHKCYGPKGIGALISNSNINIMPLIFGGRQEKAQRAGTHNVPYIVGMAKAYALLEAECDNRIHAEKRHRDRIFEQISTKIPDVVITGHPTNRLSNHTSFAFRNVDGLSLLALLDQSGFAVSIGSACRSTSIKGQQQLRNIGLDNEWTNGGLRITVGAFTTDDAVDELTETLARYISFLRKNTR